MLYPATGSGELLGAFQLTRTEYDDATPVPFKLTVALGLLDELLVMVRVPAAAPAAVGSNSMLAVVLWLGFRVIGKLPPAREKPVPLTVAELTVTGEPPVEVKVSDCVVGVFSFTFPNAMLVALRLSVAAVATFSCSAKV